MNNTKLGITTVWSLEKFESKLMQMRETYQVMQLVIFNIKYIHRYIAMHVVLMCCRYF